MCGSGAQLPASAQLPTNVVQPPADYSASSAQQRLFNVDPRVARPAGLVIDEKSMDELREQEKIIFVLYT